METLGTIFNRRSIRKYSGEPVSREQLLTLAKAGMAAPTSRDTRHFRFVIVDDEALIRRLNDGLPYAKMLASAKHAIVLIGENTKNLFKFVRWEMELALKKDIPIIAVNLNDKRRIDPDRCPSIIRDEYVVHISFNMKIIKYALDNFPN